MPPPRDSGRNTCAGSAMIRPAGTPTDSTTAANATSGISVNGSTINAAAVIAKLATMNKVGRPNR